MYTAIYCNRFDRRPNLLIAFCAHWKHIHLISVTETKAGIKIKICIQAGINYTARNENLHTSHILMGI